MLIINYTARLWRVPISYCFKAYMNDIDKQKNLNSLSEKIREFGRNK